MFRVVIDDKEINLKGSGKELLNGLSNYIYALRKTGCPLVDLQCAIDAGLNKAKESAVSRDKQANIVEDVKVHKINTKYLSAEEIAKEVAKVITDTMMNN